ncbi:MAG: putative rane protein [Herbinix sp.]|jgi:hypothetical protein|nr:putative rane protein [Herbinix sp.]
MTSTTLKIIAIITMLIDHIGAILIRDNNIYNLVFRSIGRIAFPIFAFLIVEGFYYTKNVKKYLLRLGLFALISEIPFDIAFYHYSYGGNIVTDVGRLWDLVSKQQFGYEYSFVSNTILIRLLSHQNVFFTLFLGLLMLVFIKRIEEKFKQHFVISLVLYALVVYVICKIAYFLSTDYDFSGILMIAALYFFRGNIMTLSISMFIIFGFIISQGQISISVLAVLSMLFIAFYNGKKGKDIKYFFYIFYPGHLFILFLIDQFLN